MGSDLSWLWTSMISPNSSEQARSKSIAKPLGLGEVKLLLKGDYAVDTGDEEVECSNPERNP